MADLERSELNALLYVGSSYMLVGQECRAAALVGPCEHINVLESGCNNTTMVPRLQTNIETRHSAVVNCSYLMKYLLETFSGRA